MTMLPDKMQNPDMEARSYRDWHIPFAQGNITLREGLSSLNKLGADDEEIPLIIRLVENPQGLKIFPGCVSLKQHDCIHLILGRGLLPKDEAFVIGFTMGSTKQMSTWDEKAFSWISNHLYPDIYRFDREDTQVFQDAVRLAAISHCQPLDKVDFEPLLDNRLSDIRHQLGIEEILLEAYFSIEKSRYPLAKECQRLISEAH